MTFQLECDKDSLVVISGKERRFVPVQKVEETLKGFALKGRLEWKGKRWSSIRSPPLIFTTKWKACLTAPI